MGVLVNLALWFLNRKSITVLMNVEITGNVKQKCRQAYMENGVVNGRVYDCDGVEFRVPRGKYSVEYKNESD